MSDTQKKKVAILGGGVSSMITAMELSSAPDWKDRYDITVYQMGFRLGGKGASGRNREIANRIEEHGLHLWFGFYDNAFNAMQNCYKENARPLTKPLATWEEAFKPASLIVLEEYVNGSWVHWPMEFSTNNDTPGKMEPPPTTWQLMHHALDLLWGHYGGSVYARSTANAPAEGSTVPIDGENTFTHLLATLRGLFGGHNTSSPETEPSASDLPAELRSWIAHLKHDAKVAELEVGGRLLYSAVKLIEHTLDNHTTAHHSALMVLLEQFLDDLWKRVAADIETDQTARRLWIVTDFVISNVRGMVADGVITQGFDVINNYDYRDWIKKNGATEITLDSAPVQAVYGLVFGGYQYYTFEAGTALRGALRLALTFRGSVYYRMQAGMGDTIFAPMYEVLKKRGVKFEFFHKVKNLQLDADKKNIAAVEIGVQATLKDGRTEYDPLFDVKGLPCWPSTPDYSQLVEGDALREQHIELESYWTPWKDVATKTLKWGEDFDILVQGISIGAIPVIGKELLEASESWRKMIDAVTATETQAFQLWFKPDVAGLGWPYWMEETPLSGTYKEPFDTWADMTHLLARESWPDEAYPFNLAYVCGPIDKRDIYRSWDFSDHDVPARAFEMVKQNTRQHLQTLAHHLWPNTSPENDTADFNWDLLVDLKDGKGQARFDAQFFRANIDPTELYVLSETNSSIARMKTDQNGFNNMYITGDWIDNGFNAGCVEAAVIAGKLTARAITGGTYDIPGERDLL